MHRDFHTFEAAGALVMRFEKVLAGVGIKVRNGSILEQLCLNTIDLYEKYIHPEQRPPDWIDIRPYYREMVGLYDLLVKIVSCESHPSFNQLIPHFALLNEGNPIQNIKTSVLDQDNNKLFELFVAALCLGVPVSDVLLDDPHSSDGLNPDVLATYDGVRWGLACKALHTSNPKTIMGNIEKALDQIERSNAGSGLVMLSAKNIIEHDDIWPVRKESQLTGTTSNDFIFFAYPDIDEPKRMLAEYATRIANDLKHEFGEQYLKNAFRGRKAQPVIAVYLPSAASVVRDGKPVPVRLNILNLIPLGDLTDPTYFFLDELNQRLQGSTP